MAKRGENPISKKNLKKGNWKKGESGNPKGRPLKTYTQIVNDILNSDSVQFQMAYQKKGQEAKIKAYEIKNLDGTIKELQVAALIEDAFMNGNLAAHKMIIDLSEKQELANYKGLLNPNFDYSLLSAKELSIIMTIQNKLNGINEGVNEEGLQPKQFNE